MDNISAHGTIPDNDQKHPEDPKGKIDNAAAYVGHKAEEATAYAGHKAEDAASYVGHKAEDAAGYAAQKTHDAASATGAGLRSMGGTVRERGPEGGMGGDAKDAVADSLETTGRYLEEAGLQDMMEDLTTLVRRNPVPALLISVAAGYFIGRAMTPRS